MTPRLPGPPDAPERSWVPLAAGIAAALFGWRAVAWGRPVPMLLSVAVLAAFSVWAWRRGA